MYTTGSWSVVYAIDAASGRELWKYDPEVHRKYDALACCDVVNRGTAFYDGRVYVGVLDGRLVALDAKSGKVAWQAATVDQAEPYTITGAPRVVKGKIIVGGAYEKILIDGALAERGMPRFEYLDRAAVAALRAYMLDERRKLAGQP